MDHDTIAARDGVIDTEVDCGYGDDSATADAGDPVTQGSNAGPACEHVDMLGPIFPAGP